MSDNGPQFDNQANRNFSQELKIKNLYYTPWYPQSNDQAEASNKTILTALKKRLDSAKGKWVDELPMVLWAYRTTARWPTAISPFVLTYGMKVIVPTEIGMPMLRTDLPEQSNTKTMIKYLDTSDELCEAVAVWIASYHNRLANRYNRHVKPRVFNLGDLVLRKVLENTVDLLAEKFQPKWDGPYIVTWPGKSGSYALDKLEGTPVPRMWNVMHLKRYYQ